MNDHDIHAIQNTVAAAVTTKLAYTTAGGVVVFGYFFDIQDIGIISGIMLGAATFLANLFFRIRDDRRKEKADKRLADWQKLNPGIATKSPGENLD